MLKAKKPIQKKAIPAPRKNTAASPTKTKPSPEYREYLDRYTMIGDDRPKLGSADFDRMDDELLDLLALDILDDEQLIRKQELEYLLIDPEE